MDKNDIFGTIPESRSLDTLVKVFEAEGNVRIWLHELLDDERIPYRAVVVPGWLGTKHATYHEQMFFYVDKTYAQMVRDFVDEYKNEANFIPVDNPEYDGEGVPKIICPSCGAEIDFDYHKCPHCNGSVGP